MKDKRYYITIEVTAQLSGKIEKDTPQNTEAIRRVLVNYVNSAKRELNYECYLYGDHIISINDEKGRNIL